MDDHIIITVVSVVGGKVKLGIEAPKGVHILRDELARPERVAEVEAAAKGEVRK